MAVSFAKQAVLNSIGYLLGTVFVFGLLSATLSLTSYLIAYTVIQTVHHQSVLLQNANFPAQFPRIPENITTSQLHFPTVTSLLTANFNPTPVLHQFPAFKYINYVQDLWRFLLFPLFIGGSLYTIMLAQGNGGIIQGRVIDYYNDIAWPTLVITAIVIIIYLVSGGILVIGLSSIPNGLTLQGLFGLVKLHVNALSYFHALMFLQNDIIPYFPIIVEVAAIMYLFKEVTTGWIGNEW